MKKQFRIKKNIEIQRLLKSKKNVGNRYFVIFYRENHENQNFRFAIGVSKKYGKAVYRNLIKRQIREVVKDLDFISKYDFFVIVKKSVTNLKFDEIKENLIYLFEKSKILRK